MINQGWSAFPSLKHYGNLVSDKLYPEMPWINNIGNTLPGASNASYNVGLSPLYFSAMTRIDPRNASLVDMDNGYFWSSNTESLNVAYLLGRSKNTTTPSVNVYRYYGHSLRCLVSTN